MLWVHRDVLVLLRSILSFLISSIVYMKGEKEKKTGSQRLKLMHKYQSL